VHAKPVFLQAGMLLCIGDLALADAAPLLPLQDWMCGCCAAWPAQNLDEHLAEHEMQVNQWQSNMWTFTPTSPIRWPTAMAAPQQSVKSIAGCRAHARQGSPSLVDLPQPLLAVIANSVDYGDALGRPFLATARACREAQLYGTSRIKLVLDVHEPAETVGPLSRLLDRACSEARLGVHLELSLRGLPEAQPILGPPQQPCSSNLLLALLQPAVSHGGWQKVSSLAITVRGWSS
jgi:hypothetical protein